MQIQQDNLKPGMAPTPSPKTPMSTDELLPSVSEVREVREEVHCTCPSKPVFCTFLISMVHYIFSLYDVTLSTGLILKLLISLISSYGDKLSCLCLFVVSLKNILTLKMYNFTS